MVTVIVPVCNQPSMLKTALLSIFAQTYKDFSIIVIGDSDTDVQDIITEVDKENQVILLSCSKDKGVGAARNMGIDIAKSKYIAYLNADAIYYPEHIETLLSFLENSEYKIAYTDANEAEYLTETEEKVCSPRNLISPIHCFVHERSCVKTIRFDESTAYGEDLDLWLRLSVDNKFAHIPKPTVEYTPGKEYIVGDFVSTFSKYVAEKEIAQGKYSTATNKQKQIIPITEPLLPGVASMSKEIAIEQAMEEKRIKQGRRRVYKIRFP